MTPEEIDAIPAGKQMDALIGEKVFGISKWCAEDDDDVLCTCSMTPQGTIHERISLPKFSSDIATAWKVIEKIRKIDKHWCPGVGWEDMDGLGEPGWVCGFEYYGEREEDFKEFSAIAVTMPLAVCRAALKVVSK